MNNQNHGNNSFLRFRGEGGEGEDRPNNINIDSPVFFKPILELLSELLKLISLIIKTIIN